MATTGQALTAIGSGYRLIDTAAAYGNEREVGEAIRRSGISRPEIFIETKLWISDYGPEKARVGFDASLRRLGVDYVDVYLLHQPAPADFEDTIAAYQVAEKMLQAGRARAIGAPRHRATRRARPGAAEHPLVPEEGRQQLARMESRAHDRYRKDPRPGAARGYRARAGAADR